jgi:predicted N-acyltransferase
MLKAHIFENIAQVPKEQWNTLLGEGSCTFSHEFWQVVENSGLNDFHYRYALFYNEHDIPIALAGLYSITTDIAIFAPAWLRGLLAGIRKLFPNFLKLRMIECGTPITLNSPPLVVAEKASTQEIVQSLHDLLMTTAKADGQWLIVVRDFEPNAAPYQPLFEQLGYHLVDSLPNTYMEVPWSSVEEYLASMKSYYRSKVLKHLRRNETQHIRHEVHDDFGDLAETLCRQWMVVHNQADEFQREVLTPEFYRQFSRAMGPRSKAILYYRDAELVGHALLLLDGDLLRWLYFGRNEARNDSLYIYVGYSVIETAIRLGAKRIELGLTTYSIKQDLGAQVVASKLAVRSTLQLINPFVGFVYPLMNHAPRFQNKNIFKSDPARQPNAPQPRAAGSP